MKNDAFGGVFFAPESTLYPTQQHFRAVEEQPASVELIFEIAAIIHAE